MRLCTHAPGSPPQWGDETMSAGNDRRKYPRRSVDLFVRMLFPGAGLRNVHEANVRLRDISEGGTLINVRSLTNIPDFFYLQFGSDKSEMIGCYVAGRAPGLIRAQFCNEMTTAQVDRVVAKSMPAAVIDELFGAASADDETAEDRALRALFANH